MEEETRLDESLRGLPRPISVDVFYETVKFGDIGGYVVLELNFAPGADKNGIEDYARQLANIFKQEVEGKDK